jgi:membrane protein YdbS with pleckstrin-like domain
MDNWWFLWDIIPSRVFAVICFVVAALLVWVAPSPRSFLLAAFFVIGGVVLWKIDWSPYW